MPPMWNLLVELLQRKWILSSLNHLPLHQKEGRSAHRALTKVRLAKATPIIPSTSICLHQTGIPKAHTLERKGEDGQSIYGCNVRGCEYITAQFAQACTHVCRKHLSVCVKCHLCDKEELQICGYPKTL